MKVVWSGWVLERGRREPLEAAGVFLKELKRGVYTDPKGHFRIELPPGKYTVLIKPIGFLPYKKVMDLTAPKEQTFYLLPDPNNPLQSVVKERREKKTSQQMSMSRRQLAQMTGALGGDPLRGLQNFPGVARAARVNGDLVIRGASFADSGFYVDGHRLPILYHFGAGLTVVNRRFLQRVEFFPGGAPLNFGRLTAGLVSIQSRNPDSTIPHGELYVSFAGAGLFLELPLAKGWTLSLATNRSYIDAFFSIFTKDPLTGHFWDYQAKLSYQSRHQQLSFFLLGSDDILNYAGLKDGGEVPVIGRDKNLTQLRFIRLISKYKYDKGPLLFQASLAFGFNQDGKESSTQKREIWEWPIELRIDTQLRLTKQLRLDFGLDGLWSYYHSDLRVPQEDISQFPSPSPNPSFFEDVTQKNLLAPALYAALRWEPVSNLIIQAGVRGDLYLHEGLTHWGISPRLSGSFLVHPHWRLLLSTGMYNRPPSAQEWSSDQGAPDLDLQKAVQVAGGAEYKPIKEFRIRVQGFYNHMTDLITPSQGVTEIDGKLRSRPYDNRGFGRGYGMELLARFTLWRSVQGWVSYTLSRAERGKAPSTTFELYEFDQPHIFNLMVLWRIGAGWSLNARFRYATGSPTESVTRTTYDADSDDYRPLYGPKTDRLPSFHQLDVRVDKTWVFQHWSLGFYLDIHNLYNAKNAEEFRFTYNYKKRNPVQGLPFFPAFGLRGKF